MHTLYRTVEDKVRVFLLHYSNALFIYSGLLDIILRYLLVAISSHSSNVRRIITLLSEVPQGREVCDGHLLPFATSHHRSGFRGDLFRKRGEQCSSQHLCVQQRASGLLQFTEKCAVA